MDDIIEISEINTNNSSSTLKSSNFGGGLELLMNDKIKEHKNSISLGDDLDDISKLEFELNELTNIPSSQSSSSSSASSSFGGGGGSSNNNTNTNKNSQSFNNITLSSGDSRSNTPIINVNSTLGESTSDSSYADNKTWDGFSKLNTQINPDKAFMSPENSMTKEELMREKFKILKKIETLERKGVEFSKKYNMENTLSEMLGEYETIMEERSKHSSIKFQGNMMLALVNGVEYLNGKLDYLDIKLDGWSEQVNDNITEYDDIFGELYDLYKDKASVSPWIRLMFQLGGSAFMVHLTNTMFKSAVPSMDDIFRQNPDLMKSFQTAAVNTMGQSSPGFAGFMNGVMNGNMGTNVNTQGNYEEYINKTRGGNNNYGPQSHQPNMNLPPQTRSNNNQNHNQFTGQQNQQQNARPDMKGPDDINDILSRLKPKNSTFQQPQPQQTALSSSNKNVDYAVNNNPRMNTNLNDSSTISLSELTDIQDGNVPKRSKRKPKSDKNTMSISL
jgi:hypothetical protein